MLGMLIVFHITMPFAMTLSKGLIHYYYSYATGFQNSLNRNGIPYNLSTKLAIGYLVFELSK